MIFNELEPVALHRQTNRTKQMIRRMFIAALLFPSVVIAGVIQTGFLERVTATNCQSAVDFGTWNGKASLERYQALSTTNTVLPIASSQQSFVANLKSQAQVILTNFVDHTLAVSNHFDGWFSQRYLPPSEWWWPASPFPMWSATGLVAHLAQPTNFFTVTPWAGLSTNTLGWRGLTNTLRSLAWTAPPLWMPIIEATNRIWTGATSSWAVAKAKAEASESWDWGWTVTKTTSGRHGTNPISWYLAEAETSIGYANCYVTTQFYKEVDFYVMADLGLLWSPADYSLTFDPNGDGVSTNWIWKSTLTGWNGSFSNLYGDTTFSLGNWADQPDLGLPTLRGYELYGATLARWTGFTFK